jgi:hypothetical protein
MLAAAHYRGPDGGSAELFGSVGLGHAKMAITPEERRIATRRALDPAQPSSDAGYWIARAEPGNDVYGVSVVGKCSNAGGNDESVGPAAVMVLVRRHARDGRIRSNE